MSRSIDARLIALLVCLFVPRGAGAQARLTGADIDGAVRDELGTVVPGTLITVTNLATNLSRVTTTDGQGHFVVPALAPGTYRLTAELSGFRPETREPVELRLGQSVQVDFMLRVEGRQEALTVLAEAPLVDVRDASIHQAVAREQIEGLPINGRNFTSFAVLTPGVTRDNTPQQGATATSGLSFAGQRARSNNVMVDGLDNNDLAGGSIRAVFSQEAIREFQVLTNSYSAEFGKASGGVLNIVTKSGTNAFHGNLFGYFRDRSLNARDYFEQFDVFGNPIQGDKAPFHQYQYGATAGGPIKRDRTFFFLSFERLEVTASNLVSISAADAAILNGAGFPVTIGANQYDVRQTQWLAKIDHHWRPDSNAVLRANYSDTLNENIAPFGGLVAKSRGGALLAKDVSLSASQSNVWAARWVNEARVQYARQDQNVVSLDPVCGGPCLATDQGGPTVEIAGVANVGRQRLTPQPRLSNRIQVVDTMSYFSGNHQIKVGVDYNWIHSEDGLPAHFGGRYVFSDMAALVAGTPAAYVQGYGNEKSGYTYNDVSIFLQDEWRATDRITVKPGLRYQAQIWPARQYDVSDLNGARFRYPLPPDWNNIAPRLSITIDPKGDRRSAVHGSYGLFYDNHITGVLLASDVISGSADGVRTLVTGGAVAQAAWNAPGRRLSEAQATTLLGGPFPSIVIALDPTFETPYAHHVSFGYERALGNTVSLSADVLHVRGKHQLGTIDYNPRVPALGGPMRRPNDVNGAAGTSTSVLQYTGFGETWYRGLTLSAQKRYSKGSQLLVSYAWSSAEDNSPDFQSIFVPQSLGLGRDPAHPTALPRGFDPGLERGPSVWDQRHRLVISGLYEFPRRVQVGAILTTASGRPFTPLAGADLNGDGNGAASPPDRARVNPADITTSVARNSGNLPGEFSIDVRLSRKFRLGNTLGIEPIAEAFNLFNNTNYTAVNDVFGPGAFPGRPSTDAQGRVTYETFTQAQPPRQVQLAVKISF